MREKYDIIGTDYNDTRQADAHIAARLMALLQPVEGKQYLDIGCGTGNYTAALFARGINMFGIDPSEHMLTIARHQHPEMMWQQGSAAHIPAATGQMAGVIATLTIHHWKDLYQCFKEISRVLTDTGKLVLFSATPEQMRGYWLNHYFPQMLQHAIRQMPSLGMITAAAAQANLVLADTEKYFVQHDLTDHFLYAGKDRPHLYFDERVRRGISSFATLANASEVRQGLSNLARDMEDGTFAGVKERYRNETGDYIFMVLGKKGVS